MSSIDGTVNEMNLPTGSVKIERSPPERKVVSSSHSRVIPKTWKNGNRYTQLSAKLESDIDKPERWLFSERMLCEQLPCPNKELHVLGPPTQNPRWYQLTVRTEEAILDKNL